MPVTGPGPDRAIVFQNYSLLPRLSLFENVRVACAGGATEPRRVGRRARRALPPRGRALGSPQQAAERGVGRHAAAHRGRPRVRGEPRILLLDEPFGALDALTRARLQLQLIDLWQNESKTETVLMVTHGIEEAIFLADRIIVMGNPPGPSIIDDIPVPLARPRDRVTMIDDSRVPRGLRPAHEVPDRGQRRREPDAAGRIGSRSAERRAGTRGAPPPHRPPAPSRLRKRATVTSSACGVAGDPHTVPQQLDRVTTARGLRQQQRRTPPRSRSVSVHGAPSTYDRDPAPPPRPGDDVARRRRPTPRRACAPSPRAAGAPAGARDPEPAAAPAHTGPTHTGSTRPVNAARSSAARPFRSASTKRFRTRRRS